MLFTNNSKIIFAMESLANVIAATKLSTKYVAILKSTFPPIAAPLARVPVSSFNALFYLFLLYNSILHFQRLRHNCLTYFS